MERFIEYMRSNYREIFNVNEVDDLPLILLTEVINQSVLRGATRISVTYDGKVICVKDNAKPYDDDMEFEVRPRGVGMMDPKRQRLFRILDRQWGKQPLATVNALCKDFTLISSEGERMKSLVCKDGLVVSYKEEKIGIGDGNMVIMRAFLFAESFDNDVLEELLEVMEYRLPHVTFQYNRKNQ